MFVPEPVNGRVFLLKVRIPSPNPFPVFNPLGSVQLPEVELITLPTATSPPMTEM